MDELHLLLTPPQNLLELLLKSGPGGDDLTDVMVAWTSLVCAPMWLLGLDIPIWIYYTEDSSPARNPVFQTVQDQLLMSPHYLL